MEREKEAHRLKKLAEEAYTSNLQSAITHATEAERLFPSLDGLSEMLTAFDILSSASSSSSSSPLPDHYKTLQTQPFSPFSIIKKQFRKLALTLHPDKNPFSACQEAFKHVSLAFTVLSDKTSRNNYDTRLRLHLQNHAMEEAASLDTDTFQTVCVCGLMQRFHMTYLGHNLLCPGCRNSFKALEVEIPIHPNEDDTEDEVIGSMFNRRVSKSFKGSKPKPKPKPKTCRVGELLEREMPRNGDLGSDEKASRLSKSGEIEEDEGLGIDKRALRSKRGVRMEVSGEEEDEITLAEVLKKSMEKKGNDSGVSTLRRRVGVSVSGQFKEKRVEIVEEESTLVEASVSNGFKEKGNEIVEDKITLAGVSGESIPINGELGGLNRVLRSSRGGKRKFWGKSMSNSEEIEEEGIALGKVLESSMMENGELSSDKRVLRPKRGVGLRVSSDDSKLIMGNIVEEGITLAEMQLRARNKVREEKMRLRVKEKLEEGDKGKTRTGNKKMRRVSNDGDVEKMVVQDSDFYNFHKDRVERSFKKGQVWAVYDDDDGMPRLYGLIDEVSVFPFKIKLIWLEFESSANEELLSWENTGVLSCGRFKVAKTELIYSVNIFSHYVDAERAAREVYRIYPKKGSVWALFEESTSQNRDKRGFDLVVCLTSYDETYGLSMAYLEKVDGLKTVFKRREIGSHAIKWLAKADFRLFSHQIPAWKLCAEEALDLSRDCWELDPASLPPEMLTIGWHK